MQNKEYWCLGVKLKGLQQGVGLRRCAIGGGLLDFNLSLAPTSISARA